MIFYVYGIFEPGRSEPFYVGKGQGARCNNHLDPHRLSKLNTGTAKKIRKLLASGIRPEISKFKENLSESEAFNLEIELIKKYGREDNFTGCLLNHTDGGEGHSGSVQSEASIQKMRATCASRTFLEKLEVSINHTGNTNSHSDYHRGLRKRVGRFLSGNLVKEYASIQEVKADGFSTSGVINYLQGRRKNYRGFEWRYL